MAGLRYRIWYGRRDAAQVYNLVAEDTVEERIDGPLEKKHLENAVVSHNSTAIPEALLEGVEVVAEVDVWPRV